MGITKQQQRLKSVATTQTAQTAITQAQSQVYMQILLHSGLSGLAWHRQFFPEEAFDVGILDLRDEASYVDYANAKLPKTKQQANSPMSKVNILRRGRSKRVDLFLDWLEQDVFAALERGQIEALQLYIHADPNDRMKVMETYTFNLGYNDNARGDMVTGVTRESTDEPRVTLNDTVGGIQGLLKCLTKLCYERPLLPEGCAVGMTLHLKDGAPETSPNFVLSSSDEIVWGHGDGWIKQTVPLEKELSTGFHGANVRVSHMHHPALDGYDPPQRIPSHLTYDIRSSKKDDVDAPHSHHRHHIEQPTPSTVVESITANDATSTTFRETPARRHELDSQMSNVPNMKGALTGMNQPESLTQGDTQIPARIMKQAAQPAQMAESERLTLTDIERSQLAKKKQRNTTLAKKAAGSVSQGQIPVYCLCDHAEDEEGNMVKCCCCNTHQHLRCHGFSGDKDPRLPKIHACYRCLLQDYREALEDMRALVLKRRTMGIALHEGLKRKKKLAEDFKWSQADTTAVIDYLTGNSFIVASPMSHKSGFAESGKSYYVPVRHGPRFESMIAELFDPCLNVESRYHPLGVGSRPVVATQLQELLGPDLPAAAAPKPARKSKGSATVDLDETTEDVRSVVLDAPPKSGRKRGLEQDDLSRPTAKRTPVRQGSRAVHSRFILTADSRPSPKIHGPVIQ